MEFTNLVSDWQAFLETYAEHCSKLNRLVHNELTSVYKTVKILDELNNDQTVILYIREYGKWKHRFDFNKKCHFITVTKCPIWSVSNANSNANFPSKLFKKSFNQLKSLIEYKFKIK